MVSYEQTKFALNPINIIFIIPFNIYAMKCIGKKLQKHTTHLCYNWSLILRLLLRIILGNFCTHKSMQRPKFKKNSYKHSQH